MASNEGPKRQRADGDPSANGGDNVTKNELNTLLAALQGEITDTFKTANQETERKVLGAFQSTLRQYDEVNGRRFAKLESSLASVDGRATAVEESQKKMWKDIEILQRTLSVAESVDPGPLMDRERFERFDPTVICINTAEPVSRAAIQAAIFSLRYVQS